MFAAVKIFFKTYFILFSRIPFNACSKYRPFIRYFSKIIFLYLDISRYF